MNFTQTFEEFSSGLAPMDLFLYAGIGILIWVMFKDKLSPVQELLSGFFSKIKETGSKSTEIIEDLIKEKNIPQDKQSLFFDLVVSWKQTRDLAEKSGCSRAVEVADEMFPYLSPTICGEDDE